MKLLVVLCVVVLYIILSQPEPRDRLDWEREIYLQRKARKMRARARGRHERR